MKKLPFQFGDWVAFSFTVEFVAEHSPGSWGSWKRVMRTKNLWRKTPAVGRVVGIIRRYTGTCISYGEDGTEFKTEKSILVVQVRRGLTSKIEECLPEQLRKLEVGEIPDKFPDHYVEYPVRWSEQDRQAMREEAAKMSRDRRGRFTKYVSTAKVG